MLYVRIKSFPMNRHSTQSHGQRCRKTGLRAAAIIAASVAGLGATTAPSYAQASDPFLGQIAFVAFNFTPRGWAACDGQLLPIAQNSALFSLLGTIYGGDGRTTFALPDMRGRIPLHPGNGPGLPSYTQGQRVGNAETQLTTNQLPSHTHTLRATTEEGTTTDPTGALPAIPQALPLQGAPKVASYKSGATVKQNMASDAVTNTGGNQAFSNLQPSLSVRCIIAITGIFPSRN